MPTYSIASHRALSRASSPLAKFRCHQREPSVSELPKTCCSDACARVSVSVYVRVRVYVYDAV